MFNSSKGLLRRDFLQLALALPCALVFSESERLLAEDVDPSILEPTLEEATNAIDALNRTSALNVTDERISATRIIQRSVDRLRASEFESYFNAKTPSEASSWESERAVLRYLNESFDKVLCELKETTVADNTVVFWQIYNMGYIVKTPTQTIAIDIRHRRASELEPFVDYLLVTHNHRDHFTKSFCNLMESVGKPVISNFLDNDWRIEEKESSMTIGDSSLRLVRVDHNKNLRDFVTTFEIDCGPRSNNCVIYHVGDACDVTQLAPTKKVDVFIPHLAVGLDVSRAVNETIKPKLTALSHILELGHLIDKWRWSYEYGYNQVKRCANDSVILPVWGERIVYTK